MAQKHKSKYKAPKDLEKSQKPKIRKDLKDYTIDDKDEKLNPKSTGEKQSNVLRKTDKETVDTGEYDVKYNADDRLYKDLEDGEYDPKHAAKVFKKRQDKDEKDNEKNIKDKIENLTREQKEHLVREYVRRKIASILKEAEEAPAEETPEAPAEETPETPAEETPTDTAATPPTDTATPTPDAATAPATPPAETSAAPTTPPAETPAAPATPATPEELESRSITTAAEELAKEGAIGKIKVLSKMLKSAMKEVDPADQSNFYKLLRSFAIKKIASLEPEINKK